MKKLKGNVKENKWLFEGENFALFFQENKILIVKKKWKQRAVKIEYKNKPFPIIFVSVYFFLSNNQL